MAVVPPEEIVLTTAPGIDGYRAIRVLAVITGGGAYEQKLFGDVLPAAREASLGELRSHASRVGANAVIAVSFNISLAGNHWVVVASGTAVQLEKVD